jgi:hypothetical protein
VSSAVRVREWRVRRVVFREEVVKERKWVGTFAGNPCSAYGGVTPALSSASPLPTLVVFVVGRA